ncbi:hypothetical protein FOZ61_009935, partial [Perkinsus olseni]
MEDNDRCVAGTSSCHTINPTTRPRPPPPLEVIATTWARESHELYDYESRNVRCQRFIIPMDDGDEGSSSSSTTSTLYRVRDGGSSSMMLHDGRSRAMISNASGIIEVPITSTRSSVIMKHDNNNNSSSSSTGSSRHGDDDEKGQEREEPLIRIERDPTDDGLHIKPVVMVSPSISNDNNNNSTATPPLPSSRPWLVVHDSSSPSSDYDDGVSLEEGDVIKLGRVELKVRQMVYDYCAADGGHKLSRECVSTDDDDGGGGEGGCCSSLTVCCSNDDHDVQLQLLPKGVSKGNNIGKYESSMTVACSGNSGIDGSPLNGVVCRICLMEGSTADDPFIAPCHCSGSIKYVHINCLRHWIAGRLRLPPSSYESDYDSARPIPTGAAASPPFLYRPLTCELCKAPYPTYVSMNGSIECLYPLPHVKAPYIVFEVNLKPVITASTRDNNNNGDDVDDQTGGRQQHHHHHQQGYNDDTVNGINPDIGLNVVSLASDDTERMMGGSPDDDDDGGDPLSPSHRVPTTTNTSSVTAAGAAAGAAGDDDYEHRNHHSRVEGALHGDDNYKAITIGRGHESQVRITDVILT